jgi:hypothetical protein
MGWGVEVSKVYAVVLTAILCWSHTHLSLRRTCIQSLGSCYCPAILSSSSLLNDLSVTLLHHVFYFVLIHWFAEYLWLFLLALVTVHFSTVTISPLQNLLSDKILGQIRKPYDLYWCYSSILKWSICYIITGKGIKNKIGPKHPLS